MGVWDIYRHLGRSALLAAALGITAYLGFGALTGNVATTVDAPPGASAARTIIRQPLWVVPTLALPAFLLWPIPPRISEDLGRVVRTGAVFGIGLYAGWFVEGWSAYVEPGSFLRVLLLVLLASFIFPVLLTWRPPGFMGISWKGLRSTWAGLLLGGLNWAFGELTGLSLILHAVMAGIMAFGGLLDVPTLPRDARYWEVLVAAPLGWAVVQVILILYEDSDLLLSGPIKAWGLPVAVLTGAGLAYYASGRLVDSPDRGIS